MKRERIQAEREDAAIAANLFTQLPFQVHYFSEPTCWPTEFELTNPDGAILLRPAVGVLIPGLRADAADSIFNRDGTRLLKYERPLDHVVLS